MYRIKINSNPYKKQLQFSTYNEINEKWEAINNSNSKLLSEEIKSGFFPFKVKKIVDVIISEYRNKDENIIIEFEGTRDEYNELKSLSLDDDYKNIIIANEPKLVLENARDILPSIKGMFQEIKDLVYESITDKKQVDAEFNRLIDASSDVIPICVLGNYSCGKSTFINALIGYEILPSGSDPITAKVFKITNSLLLDQANVSFELDSKTINISFMDNRYEIDGEIVNTVLLEQIKEVLEDNVNDCLSERVYNLLDLINMFDNEEEHCLISDLINVSVPFRAGVWTEINNKFVIFDTPGSNSASNATHLKVLKNAMQELSNGLIIFVSKYDTLDSIDNENLFLELNKMDELDSRFTMIVVNQADSVQIPKNHERALLRQSVPKKLRSDNIMFVSSIMGLGSKNDCSFINEHCEEIYSEKVSKFNNPNEKFYKQLYKLNVMPEQLKKRMIKKSEECVNIVYANSGLYCIEDNIQTFANKYSSYNKCQQSLLFLRKIIEITTGEIKQNKKDLSNEKQQSEKKLRKDKKILKQKIENKSEELYSEYKDSYIEEVNNCIEQSKYFLDKKELDQLEERFYKEEKQNQKLGEKQNELQESASSIAGDFVEDAKATFDDLRFDLGVFDDLGKNLSNWGNNIVGNISDTIKNAVDVCQINQDVKRIGSDRMLEYIKEKFHENIHEFNIEIEYNSKKYWEEKSKEMKDGLCTLITDSEELSKEKRNELSNIVIQYENVKFDNNEKGHFSKKDLTDTFYIDFNFFNECLNLDKNKLKSTFNGQMEIEKNKMFKEYGKSHNSSFAKWENDLLGMIKENITKYNPSLYELSLHIKELEVKINDLENKNKMLNNYEQELEKLMEWKEN